MVQLFVQGKPTGKQRPKFNKKTKNTYTPKETRDYETLVKTCYKQKYGNKEPIPAKTPVEVEIYAYFKIPKSMPKKQVKLIENNELFPTVKPDADNIILTIKICFVKGVGAKSSLLSFLQFLFS